jgi:hypothetical protein
MAWLSRYQRLLPQHTARRVGPLQRVLFRYTSTEPPGAAQSAAPAGFKSNRKLKTTQNEP